jgi:predicted permease
MFVALTPEEAPKTMDDVGQWFQRKDRIGNADFCVASPAYFHALGIPLVRGRLFDDRDRGSAPHAAVISESLARSRWPGEDPIGRTIEFGNMDGDLRLLTIVGIVGDTREYGLEQPPRPTVYVPYGQDAWPSMVFTLRVADARSASLQTSVRSAIWQIDKDQPIGAILTMDEQLSKSLTRRRFSVTLLSAFGVVAVALAAIGLYGVLAFIVAQRRREIGVRMALGAQPRDVIADVMGQGLRLAGIGVVVGIALAVAGSRLLNSLLFGTSPTDAVTFVGVATLLVAISAAASLVPALRASRVDPLIALREE